MSERDPFRPPPDADAGPVELARPPQRPAASDADFPTITPRPAKRYPRPNRRGDIVLWLFAFIGAATMFVVAVRHVRKVFERVPEVPSLPSLGGGPTWQPLAMGDAVLIQFQLKPRDAAVFIDGSPAPSNPLRLARGSTPLRVLVTRSGFEPHSLELIPDKNQTIAVELARDGKKRP